MKQIFTIITLFILLSCGKSEAEKDKEVFSIRSIGTLSTTEYTVGKIIKLNDKGEWYTFGERKILMSCKAKIKGGINLQKLKEEDLIIEGEKVTIKLPAAEIISFEMDPSLIKTEFTEVNGFRSNFSQEEKANILKLGETAIRTDMKQLGILKEAERNAIAFLKKFYANLGYSEIYIYVKETKTVPNVIG